MFFVLSQLDGVEDFERWKEGFDRDKFGRERTSGGFELMRSVDVPGVVFVKTAFESVITANAHRDRLMSEGPKKMVSATVLELVESAGY
jgi:hypothetical protein